MHPTSRFQSYLTRRRRRGYGARLLVLGLLLFLLVPLYRMQVIGAEDFELQAQQYRLRPIMLPAPRGTIYDRNGRVVAESVVGYKLMLMPDREEELRKKVARLQPVLGLTDEEVEAAFRRHAEAPHMPLELVRDASPVVIARMEEHRFLFPEVLVVEYSKRYYPAGPATAHFLGYVSEISEAELKLPEFAGYQPGRLIGKAGLERQYEKHLGGEPGFRYLEIDARGRIRRWLPNHLSVAPKPGKDLHLYLDLDLQEYIAKIFPKEYTGAIVALDPKTGGILAYYSHPTFDPNEFVGGIPARRWQELLNDPKKPLLDRVISSPQPAASTWKLAVAAMALSLDAIRPDEYMPIPCTGGMTWGRYARCWDRRGHGRVNLIEGIKNSCNVYFYQVGIRIGLDRFLETGSRLGFTKKTGVDLPHEISPIFPTSREYWKRRFGYTPTETEILSLSIGQGPITMTVLKLAQIYAALARPDGKVPAPRFVADFGPPPDTFHIDLNRRDVWYLHAGMRRVVGPGGTAALSRLKDWDFIGKTGTAENAHGKDHAWFVGTGAAVKGGEPEIAVTMLLEFGEHGYVASGYVAEAINFYLNKKYGKPQPDGGFATPRLRLANNLPVDWDWNAPVEDPPLPPDSAAVAVGGEGRGGGRGGVAAGASRGPIRPAASQTPIAEERPAPAGEPAGR